MNNKIKKMLLLELGIISLVLIIFIIIKLNILKYIPECFLNRHFGILCPSCRGYKMYSKFYIWKLLFKFFISQNIFHNNNILNTNKYIIYNK